MAEPRLAEPLDDPDALFSCRRLEVFEIDSVRFFEARDPDDALYGHLHRETSIDGRTLALGNPSSTTPTANPQIEKTPGPLTGTQGFQYTHTQQSDHPRVRNGDDLQT